MLSDAGVDLLNKLLTYDPDKRITARQALRHPYFSERPLPRLPEYMPSFPSGEGGGARQGGPLWGVGPGGQGLEWRARRGRREVNVLKGGLKQPRPAFPGAPPSAHAPTCPPLLLCVQPMTRGRRPWAAGATCSGGGRWRRRTAAA